MNNSGYWAYNLPLQISPNYAKFEEDADSYVLDDKGNKKIESYTIVNYSPRKNRVTEFDLSECLDTQSREEFLEYAAQHLENLARLMRECIHNPEAHVYYHDADFDLDVVKLEKNLRKP